MVWTQLWSLSMAIIEEINALIREPFYLRFADQKVRLCRAIYRFCSMDGDEVAAT